jgi:hypothetical protein
MIDAVWVFNGADWQFPSGVFSSRELAEEWITKYSLTGVLTKYPVDLSVYDWSIQKGFFQPKTDKDNSPGFIQRISSAYQEHYHYENGKM